MGHNLPFVKMHGAGNDFIMVESRHLPAEGLTRAQIAAMCHRRHGIGADGLMVIQAPAVAGHDFAMTYYNGDGGKAEMCGNGARCAVAHANRLGLVSSRCHFETGSGVLAGELSPDGVTVSLPPWRDLRVGLSLAGSPFETHHFVDTGVPHLVIPVPDVAAVDLATWGPMLRRHPDLGTAGANVDWVETRPDPEGYPLRTYERGVEAETLACGTGAAAVAVVLCHLKLATSPVTLWTRGGDRLVVGGDLNTDRGTLWLKGPAVVTFSGEIELSDLERDLKAG